MTEPGDENSIIGGDNSGILGNGVLLVEGSPNPPIKLPTLIPIRIPKVEGFEGRCNDIIYCSPLKETADINDEVKSTHTTTTNSSKDHSVIVFFGGDMQDYQELMEIHRDHRTFSNWNLENTAKHLQAQFPNHHIVVIRPVRMHMLTFSCFENFVPCNINGVPDHTPSYNSLQHLEALLRNLSLSLLRIRQNSESISNTPTEQSSATSTNTNSGIDTTEESKENCLTTPVEDEDSVVSSTTDLDLLCESRTNESNQALKDSSVVTTIPKKPPQLSPIYLDRAKISIVGFSKGCVVLNQFLYEFHYLKTLTPDDPTMENFLCSIDSMYWLDGGHNGGKNSWITSRSLLETLTRLKIKIQVHLTQYQLLDERRPWIRKEEKTFSDILRRNTDNFYRKVHFEEEPPSLDLHLQVLANFGLPDLDADAENKKENYISQIGMLENDSQF